MLESTQSGVLEYKKLSKEEMKQRGILGRLIGVCADFLNPTRNGRKYPEKLWENVFNDPIMQERIENNCCFGELGHPPDREETDMEKVAIVMDGVPKKDKDGKLRAVFNIVDTPNGRILKSLCDYGSTIGISSRGSGDLETDYDGNESVNPDTYNCEGFDAVLIPAVKEARLQYVTESLNKTRYNKTLRDKLTESINREDENNQKIMRESLNILGISLDESTTNEYNGYGIQTTSYGTAIWKDGKKLITVASDDEAREWIDNNESLTESANGAHPLVGKKIKIIDRDESYLYGKIFQITDVDDSGTSLYINCADGPTTIRYNYDRDIYDKFKLVESLSESTYTAPISKDDINFELTSKWIADDLNRRNLPHTTENVIEMFRMLNDDYDDFWARGLRTKEQEKEFVDKLINGMKKYGITDVVDDTFNESLNEELNMYPIEYSYTIETDDRSENFYGHINVKANSEEEAIEKADRYLHSNEFEYKNKDITNISNISIGDTQYSNADSLDESYLYDDLKNKFKLVESLKTAYIVSLPRDVQYQIKDDVTKALQDNGLSEDEIDDCVMDALSGRLSDLEDTIDINKYLKESISYKSPVKNWRDLAVGDKLTMITDEFDGKTTEEVEVVDVDSDRALFSPLNDPDIKLWIDDDFWDENNVILNEGINQETDNINNEAKSSEADNNGSMVEELQKAMYLNRKLDEKIIDLQEKLSVSYAKEMELSEELDSYKSRVVKLSQNSSKVKSLTEQVSSMTNALSHRDLKYDELKTSLSEKLSSKNESIKKLTESVKRRDEKIKTLRENLSAVKTQVQELTLESDTLKEDYANMQKDLSQLQEHYSKKLDAQNMLVEKYKNIAVKSVDKYIDTQARNLGIKSHEIKNRLPESYSFKDIDSVCEDLREYKLNISSLPFSTSNRLNENISLRASNISSKSLVSNPDDEITELELRLAGLN